MNIAFALKQSVRLEVGITGFCQEQALERCGLSANVNFNAKLINVVKRRIYYDQFVCWAY